MYYFHNKCMGGVSKTPSRKPKKFTQWGVTPSSIHGTLDWRGKKPRRNIIKFSAKVHLHILYLTARLVTEQSLQEDLSLSLMAKTFHTADGVDWLKLTAHDVQQDTELQTENFKYQLTGALLVLLRCLKGGLNCAYFWVVLAFDWSIEAHTNICVVTPLWNNKSCQSL